jgi:hypothetical protein
MTKILSNRSYFAVAKRLEEDQPYEWLPFATPLSPETKRCSLKLQLFYRLRVMPDAAILQRDPQAASYVQV